MDYATLLPNDPDPVAVSQDEARIVDESGVTWTLRVGDDTTHPPLLRLDSPSDAPSLPTVAAQGSLRYLVGSIHGVLVADPQRWSSDAIANGFLGWFLFGESPASPRRITDHRDGDYTGQTVGTHMLETDRNYDSERGWSLTVTAGRSPTLVHRRVRGLGSNTTTTFWINPTAAAAAACPNFLTHGPLVFSLLSGQLVVAVDGIVSALTAPVLDSRWNFFAVTLAADGCTLWYGTNATPVSIGSTETGSPRVFSATPNPLTINTVADGSVLDVPVPESGAISESIRVSVDGAAWPVVPTLLNVGASARVCQLVDINGVINVRFGNGFDGAIPPDGSDVEISYETSDAKLVLRTTAALYNISDLRMYSVVKTEAELNEIRLPSMVEAPVAWSLRFITSTNQRNRYALEVLPSGYVYATSTADWDAGVRGHDKDRSFAEIVRYDGDGVYGGDPARELIGLGGGIEPPSVFTLGTRLLGFDSSNVVVYSGTFGYPRGSITEEARVNPIARHIYLHHGTLTYKAGLVTENDAVRLLAEPVVVEHYGMDTEDLPNVPTDGQVYTYQGSWAATSYNARDVVLRGSTYWYATSGALAGNIPPASPWMPAHSLYYTRYADAVTDAVTVYGSNAYSLGVRYGTEVYALPNAAAGTDPLYMYLDASTIIDVPDATASWAGGGTVLSGRVELDTAGLVTFSHAEVMVGGRYRLYLDLGNNGLLDRDFDGFDLEMLLGESEPVLVEARVFSDHAGESNPREEVYVDVTLPTIECPWTLKIRWSNAIQNDDNWQRVLQIFGYRLELLEGKVWRVGIPNTSGDISLTEVGIDYSGSTAPTAPGAWIGLVNSYGTVASGSWIHESRVYDGESSLPISHRLTVTSPDKREDLYTEAWYEADTGTIIPASPSISVYGSREREVMQFNVNSPVGTLRYAWDFTSWGDGWSDGQSVTSVAQGHGTLSYTAYAIDPNGYYSITTGSVVVHEAPDIKYVRTSADDEVVPYTYSGTVYGTCTTGTLLQYDYYLDGTHIHTGTSVSPFGTYVAAPLTLSTSGLHTLRVVATQYPQDTYDEVYLNVHGRASVAPTVSPIRGDPAVLYAESTTNYTYTVIAYDEDGEESDLTFTWAITGTTSLSFTQEQTSWGNERMQSTITVPVTSVTAGDEYVVSVVVSDAHGRQTVRYLRLTVKENTPPELVEDESGEPIRVTPGVLTSTNRSVVFEAARAVDAEDQYPVTYAWNLFLHRRPTLPVDHTLTAVADSTFAIATSATNVSGGSDTVRSTRTNNTTALIEEVTGVYSELNPALTLSLYVLVEGVGYGTAVSSDKLFRGIRVRLQQSVDGVPMWLFGWPNGYAAAATLTEEQEALVNVSIWPYFGEVSRDLRLTTYSGQRLTDNETKSDSATDQWISTTENGVSWNDVFPLRLSGTEQYGNLYLSSYPEEYAKYGSDCVFVVNVSSVVGSDVAYTASTRSTAIYAAADEGVSATITGSLTLTDDRGGLRAYPVPTVTLLERCLPPYISPPNGPVDSSKPVSVDIRPRTKGSQVRYTTGAEPLLPPTVTMKSVAGRVVVERAGGNLYTRTQPRPQLIQINVKSDLTEGVNEWYGLSFVLYAKGTPFYFYFSNETGRGENTPDPVTAPDGAVIVSIPVSRADMTPVLRSFSANFTSNSTKVTINPSASSGLEDVRANWEIVDVRPPGRTPEVLAGGEYVDAEGVNTTQEAVTLQVLKDESRTRTHNGRYFDLWFTTPALAKTSASRLGFVRVWFYVDGLRPWIKPEPKFYPEKVPLSYIGSRNPNGRDRVNCDLVKVTIQLGASARDVATAIAAAMDGNAYWTAVASGDTVVFTRVTPGEAKDARNVANWYKFTVTSSGEASFAMSSVALASATNVPINLVGGAMSKQDIARLMAEVINSQSEFVAALTSTGAVTVSVQEGSTHDFSDVEGYLSSEVIIDAVAEQVTALEVPVGQSVKAIAYKDGTYPSHVTEVVYETK